MMAMVRGVMFICIFADVTYCTADDSNATFASTPDRSLSFEYLQQASRYPACYVLRIAWL